MNENKFSLSSVTSARVSAPMRCIIYGAPGVGKTTCAACFPKPILIRTEDGAGEIDVPTFPLVRSMSDLGQALRTLLSEQHDFETLIIDSLDWLEPLVWKSVCEEGRKQAITEFGYGQGYQLALNKWKSITESLDTLRKRRNMHIVLIAHADTKKIDSPDAPAYLRYDMKLHASASNHIMEWSDYMFFLAIQTTVAGGDERRGTSGKAFSTGERIVNTGSGVTFQGKSRRALPPAVTCSADYHELMTVLFPKAGE